MPYPPCTVTALWLKYQDPDRCLCRVTQPPHIAGPLAKMCCESGHSASRTTNNFIHRDKTDFHHLSICTATLNWFLSNFVSGDNFVCLDKLLCQPHNPAHAHIKNWLPAAFNYQIHSIRTNYLFYIVCTAKHNLANFLCPRLGLANLNR